MEQLPKTWRKQLTSVFYALAHGFNTFADYFINHWLGIINIILGGALFFAILTPLLAYAGYEPLAGVMFRSYHLICDQIPSHSYFICGHQIGICARCLAIYTSLFIFSLGFRKYRAKIPPLDWKVFVLLLLPMALDGGTQLFGWRQSFNELRVLTGALFGLGVFWFTLPRVQYAIDETKTADLALAAQAQA